MVKTQEWLEEKYPKEVRDKKTRLDISNKELEEELDLTEFISLEYLDCGVNKLTSLNISNLGNLKEVSCYGNKITILKVSGLNNLEYLDCATNYLTDINLLLSDLNHKKLRVLYLTDNNFSNSDLTPFSKFTNLEGLAMSSNIFREDYDQGITNRFFGSLKPLKNLNKLTRLGIENTDIDSGLEYLPDTLETLWCYNNSKARKEAKASELYRKELYGSNGNIQIWREFNNSPAQRWLDRNYPESEEKKEITKLGISNKELEGGLKLRNFTNLKEIYCSNNKLTNLDLSDCWSLIKLQCFYNELHDLNFLKNVSNLEILNVNYCSLLEGSLKPLENLSNLKELRIINTNLSEGLEYLSESCQKLYCNSEHSYKSTKFMEELDKSNCSEGEGSDKCYNLDKWRENKQNDLAISIISPERLFAIRSNVKQFVNKWGKKDKEGFNELSKLQSPEELHKYYRWKIYTTQFIGRGAAVVGVILTFRDQGTFGGGILGVYPFAELLVSRLEKSLDDKKSKWREFLTDTDTFLDNYNGLLGIMAQFEIDKLREGEINKTLKDLDKKVKEFLNTYDKDDNKEIDISELINKKNELIRDLSKWDEKNEIEESKLQGIMNTIKNLEKAVIEYRRFSYYGISKEKSENSNATIIDLDKWIEEKENNDSNALSTSGTSQSTNVFRKRNISNSKENRLSQEIYELVDLQSKEELQTKIEIPPKN